MTIEVGSGDALPKLAPDLTWPSTRSFSGALYAQVTGIDASSGLTTVLSLAGKFKINYVELSAMTAETNTIKVTVDGVVIMNGTNTFTENAIIGGTGNNPAVTSEEILCNTSFLLEVQTTSDTNITLKYIARPIL